MIELLIHLMEHHPQLTQVLEEEFLLWGETCLAFGHEVTSCPGLIKVLGRRFGYGIVSSEPLSTVEGVRY